MTAGLIVTTPAASHSVYGALRWIMLVPAGIRPSSPAIIGSGVSGALTVWSSGTLSEEISVSINSSGDSDPFDTSIRGSATVGSGASNDAMTM